MAENPINKSVCTVCGANKDSGLGGLNALGDDPYCGECRSYQQKLIMSRMMDDKEAQRRKREAFFGGTHYMEKYNG